MSERMSEDMSERISKNISDKISEDVYYGSEGRCLQIRFFKINTLAIGNAAKLMTCHLMWCFAANTCDAIFREQASEVGLATMSGACNGTSYNNLHWFVQPVCKGNWACVALCLDNNWIRAHLRVHGAA